MRAGRRREGQRPLWPLVVGCLSLLMSGGALRTAQAMPVVAEPLLSPSVPVADEVRAALREAMYARQPLLGDEIAFPRPAAEALKRLREVAGRFPKDPAVQRYLSRAAVAAGEVALAEEAAQAEVAATAGDEGAAAQQALLDLADLHRDRNQGDKELAALERLAALLKQRQGKAPLQARVGRDELRQVYERLRDTARRHGLGDPLRYEREIVNLYPDDPSYLRRYLEEQVRLVATELQQQGAPGKSLSAREQALLKELKRLRGRFPALTGDLLKVEAGLYEGHRDIDAAIAVYRRDLDGDPTPVGLVPGEDRGDRYGDLVTLLRRHGRDREIIRGLAARAQAGRLAGVDLALLCAFYQGESAKLRALLTQVNTVPVGTAVPASELLLRGRLLRRYLSAAEALPVLYGGYRAALAEGAKPAVQVALLGELGRALVSDAQVATALTPLSPLTAFTLRRVSSGPSILGGLASLLFNGHVAGDNHDEARDLDGVARAMANAARATQIYEELRRLRGPAPAKAGRRGAAVAAAAQQGAELADSAAAALLSDLVDLYRDYKNDGETARLAEEYTRSFPAGARYYEIALIGCAARGRKGGGDVACYRQTLDEAARGGLRTVYGQVLQSYVDALQRQKKQPEVVRLYWGEINRFPRDGELYDRFLDYLGSRKLVDEEVRLYEAALKALPGSDMQSRMARFYLREKGQAAYRELVTKLVGSLDGDLADKLLQEVPRGDRRSWEQTFYLEVHKQALARFPLDPRLQRRLLEFYEGRGMAGPEVLRLRKQLAVDDAAQRTRLLNALAADGALDGALTTLTGRRGALSEAERLLLASALIFRSRQEEALPHFEALRKAYPHDRELLVRTAALLRAVALPTGQAAAAQAAALLEAEFGLRPSDEDLVVQAGDYLAEAGRLEDAAQRFQRIAQASPGDPEAYLRLASIQWDYYLFDGAAAAIVAARKKAADPLRFADKLAAVYESRRDYPRAIAEYVRMLSVSPPSLEGMTRAGEERSYDESGESGSYSPEANGTSAPGERLLFLSRRKGQTAAIDRAFRAEYDRDPQAAGVIKAYAGHLASRGDLPGRQRFLVQAMAKLTDLPLLDQLGEGALAPAGSDDREVRLAARRRVVVLRPGAPGPVLALAATLKGLGDARGAEAELRRVLGELDQRVAAVPPAVGGRDLPAAVADDLTESIGAREVLAGVLGEGRGAEAAALLLQAADGAQRLRNNERTDELTLSAASQLGKAGKPDDAERALRAVLARHPGEARYVDLLADQLLRRSKQTEMLALYRDQLAGVAKLPLPERRRKDLAQELRRRLVERYRSAGQARDAVELWLTAINRSPDNRQEVEDLYEYARLAGLGKRVHDHFARAAKEAFKDPRWPQVLAWIALLDGDAATAAARFGEAVALLPQRLDLRERQAELTPDLAQAGRLYQQIYELSDRSEAYGWQAVERYQLAGKGAEVKALLALLLPKDEVRPTRFAAAAEVLARSGAPVEALGYLERALDLSLLEPPAAGKKAARRGDDEGDGEGEGAGADDGPRAVLEERHTELYARLALTQGKLADAVQRLGAVERYLRQRAEGSEQGRWRWLAAADAAKGSLERTLPQLVQSHGTDADRRTLLAIAQAQSKQGAAQAERSREMLVRADLRREALVLLGQHPPTGGAKAERNQRTRLLMESAAWGGAAKLLEESGDGGRLREAVVDYRLAGDSAGELRALGAHYEHLLKGRHRGDAGFSSYDSEVARLVELKLPGEGAAGLLATQTPYTAQVATHLLRAGQAELGLRALGLLGGPAPVTALRQGLALLVLTAEAEAEGAQKERKERRAQAAQAAGLLAQALPVLHEAGVGPIGALLDRGKGPRDEATRLLGRRAMEITLRYGQALGLSGKPAAGLLAAAAEERPLAIDGHLLEGDALLQVGRTAEAVAAYRRGRVLAPHDRRSLDRLARGLYLLGGKAERAEALALWSEPLSWGGDRARAEGERCDALLATEVPVLRAEAARLYSGYLAGADKLSVEQLIDGLKRLQRAFAAGIKDEGYVRAAAQVVERRQGELALLAALVGIGREALLPPSAWSGYLVQGARLAAAPGSTGKGKDVEAWLRLQAEQALVGKRFDEALAVLTQARAAGLTGDWLLTTQVTALVGKGDKAAAVALIAADLQDPALSAYLLELRLDARLPLLRERGLDAEADELLVSAYRRVGTHRINSARLGPLYGALLRRGQAAEAGLLVARLIARGPDGVRQAAELCEQSGQFAESARLRRLQLTRAPGDAAARLALARMLYHAKQPAESAAVARGLLVDQGGQVVSRTTRAQAAALLGELRRKGLSEREAGPPAGARGDEELLALWQAQVSGDFAALRSRTAGHLAPRYALGALIQEGLRGGDKQAEAAFQDGLRLASHAGLWPWLRAALLDAAQRTGRHGLAVALALDGDPLLGQGRSLMSDQPPAERLRLLQGALDSAQRAGYPAAAVRIGQVAAGLAKQLKQREEAQRLEKLVAAQKALVQRAAELRKPLVLAKLEVGSLGAPPAPRLMTAAAVAENTAPVEEGGAESEGTP